MHKLKLFGQKSKDRVKLHRNLVRFNDSHLHTASFFEHEDSYDRNDLVREPSTLLKICCILCEKVIYAFERIYITSAMRKSNVGHASSW